MVFGKNVNGKTFMLENLFMLKKINKFQLISFSFPPQIQMLLHMLIHATLMVKPISKFDKVFKLPKTSMSQQLSLFFMEVLHVINQIIFFTHSMDILTSRMNVILLTIVMFFFVVVFFVILIGQLDLLFTQVLNQN